MHYMRLPPPPPLVYAEYDFMPEADDELLLHVGQQVQPFLRLAFTLSTLLSEFSELYARCVHSRGISKMVIAISRWR